MRCLAILFLSFIISTSAICQSQDYKNLETQIKILYKKNATTPIPKDIFINKFNKSIDIEGHQILLDSINIAYFFDNSSVPIYQNQVKFECKTANNCIIFNANNKNVSGLRVSFRSKSSCYNFINLLSEVERLMNNR